MILDTIRRGVTGTMRFRNPANGYVETVRKPALLLCTLFFAGPVYFLARRAYFAALWSIPITVIAPYALLPFASGIVRRAYLRRGWQEVQS